MYDSSAKKIAISMKRPDLCLRQFDKYEKRSPLQSIYRRERYASLDPYDLEKIQRGKIKTTKGSEKKASYSIEKQSKRDIAKWCASSVGDAYENNMRDKDRADYLQRLIEESVDY